MLVTLLLQHAPRKHLLPGWLIHFGLFGIFAVAAVDASLIPWPVPGSSDLLVLLLTAHRGNPWLATLAGVAGSLTGGYFTWSAGKAGGEALLRRYAFGGLVQRIEVWVKKNGMLTVGVACILPPPLPLMPFLVAAGALGVSRTRYMIALGTARALRYGLIAWLGVKYGHAILHLWTHYLARWTATILWILVALLVAGVCFGIWKYRHDRQKQNTEPALERI